MVEQVERFGAELEPCAVTEQGKILEQREIILLQSRAAQRIAAQIPQRAKRGPGKALGTNVIRNIPGVGRVWCAAGSGIEVRTLPAGSATNAAVAGARPIRLDGHGERRSRPRREDTAQFPSTQNRPHYARERTGRNDPTVVEQEVV